VTWKGKIHGRKLKEIIWTDSIRIWREEIRNLPGSVGYKRERKGNDPYQEY
jgi:hypothetical protein